MNLKPSEQEAVANFAQTFEAACVGLQMNNPEVPTISPEQYSVCLGAAIYATQVMLTKGDILPDEETQANFSKFLNAAAIHYANTVVSVATAKAEEILGEIQKEEAEQNDEPR